MSWGNGTRAVRRLRDRIGAGGSPAVATSVIASNTTFVAGEAGVYRVLCLTSGGSGKASTTDPRSGASGRYAYAEVSLTAGQNVSVTIGEAAAGATNTAGNNGNATSFGSHLFVSALGTRAEAGEHTGWAGGSSGGPGAALGSDGTGGTPGKGQGSSTLTWVASRFAGVALTSGAVGAQSTGGSDGSGGAAGLLVDGSGPAGTSPTTIRGGRGEGYGAGSGAVNGSGSTEASNPGVCIVEGPYPS